MWYIGYRQQCKVYTNARLLYGKFVMTNKGGALGWCGTSLYSHRLLCACIPTQRVILPIIKLVMARFKLQASHMCWATFDFLAIVKIEEEKKMECWTSPWLLICPPLGQYNHLMQELLIKMPPPAGTFYELMWISSGSFWHMFILVLKRETPFGGDCYNLA